MKFALIAAILLLGIGVGVWITYPWEYSEAATEAAFQKIAEDGFTDDTASQLIKQYRVSDASFRIHFLAFGHVAMMKNRTAFSIPLNKKWTIIAKDISSNGEMAAEDWFTPQKYQELKKSISAATTAN